MALLEILRYPDPLLKQKSAPVSEFNDQLKQLAADMVETMYAAPGVGLAAPQVGALQRLIILDCSAKDEPADLLVAVNPEIIAGEGDSLEEEGCLSVPGYWASVKRHATVTLRYQDTDGQVHEREADGLLAIGMQHEIDHLEGVLFVDRLSPLKRSMFRKKYMKALKEKEAKNAEA
ncbi:peptide deformylase [Desulfuromusa kysingii]|uniref:Peptide deformylase n=1 Tax=Desulfuromusa kysingii TaxID=37625 RepID=A0A1H3VKM4_9BACT|nr:peptide deformylase [Desulfuromusa kysingii]SDZ74804.1 peptide deformylase [Desulfuromusa kysingii]